MFGARWHLGVVALTAFELACKSGTPSPGQPCADSAPLCITYAICGGDVCRWQCSSATDCGGTPCQEYGNILGGPPVYGCADASAGSYVTAQRAATAVDAGPTCGEQCPNACDPLDDDAGYLACLYCVASCVCRCEYDDDSTCCEYDQAAARAGGTCNDVCN